MPAGRPTRRAGVCAPDLLHRATAARPRLQQALGCLPLRGDFFLEVLRPAAATDPDVVIALGLGEAADGYLRICNEIAQANVRLVVIAARGVGRAVLPVFDRIPLGNLGLLLAIEHDDPTVAAFFTCTVFWIRHTIPANMATHEAAGRTRRRAQAWEPRILSLDALIRSALCADPR